MAVIEFEMEYEAPPEVVFDLLADHTKHPQWDPHMIEGTLYEEGPIVNGSKGVTIGEMKGRRVESEIYYEAYDRPKWVSGGTTSKSSVRARNTCEFIATDKGTRIIWRLDVKNKGLMCLLEPIMIPAVRKAKKESLEALQDYIRKDK